MPGNGTTEADQRVCTEWFDPAPLDEFRSAVRLSPGCQSLKGKFRA
jgi:hypothetical protein